jgi:AcrR family transcriptional regulator
MTNDDSPPKSGLIWERLQQAPRSAQPALSRQQIVRAAIGIADREGAQAVTMRRIATELGSAAMSLYRHVFSKDDLLDLMLDQVFGEIALPERASGDWRVDLRALACETREVFKRHSWLAALTTSRPTLGPNYLRWFDRSLAVVDALGLDIATAAQVVGALYAYVGGVVSYELAEAENTRRTGLSEDDKRAYATPYVQQITASGRYPYFARFFSEGVSLDPEQGFGFGLDCLLDGMAAQLAPAASKVPHKQ